MLGVVGPAWLHWALEVRALQHMRKLSEIIQEFRSHPFKHWLGWNPPCSYELSGRSIIKRVGDSVSELAPIADIGS
jgi:hypothetical protein